MLPYQPPAGRSAAATITGSAPGATSASSPMLAGSQAASGHTPAKGVPSSRPELLGAPTPLRRSQFEMELRHHPNKAWVSRLLLGITQGVDIGYVGPREPTNARNLPSAHMHPQVVEAELQKEVQAGQIRGPFHRRPLPALRCSGLGVVPKKANKWRMIQHLSARAGSSANDFIPKEAFSLHYSSMDDAVRILITMGPVALMAKADLKSAFRMIPIRPQDWELLGMQWNGAFYFDTCLPFGLRSAPCLFNEYADALQWIVSHNYSLSNTIHYLDDYFLAGPPGSTQCAAHLQQLLQVCERLGYPSGHGQGGGASHHPHLPQAGTGLQATADPASPNQTGRAPHRAARLVTPHQSLQVHPTVPHREAVVRGQSGPSGPPVPATADRLEYHGPSAPPPDPPRLTVPSTALWPVWGALPWAVPSGLSCNSQAQWVSTHRLGNPSGGHRV